MKVHCMSKTRSIYEGTDSSVVVKQNSKRMTMMMMNVRKRWTNVNPMRNNPHRVTRFVSLLVDDQASATELTNDGDELEDR